MRMPISRCLVSNLKVFFPIGLASLEQIVCSGVDISDYRVSDLLALGGVMQACVHLDDRRSTTREARYSLHGG